MAVTFALRGTSLTAYRALEAASYGIMRAAAKSDPSLKTSGLPAGCFGNSVIQFGDGTAYSGLLYQGNKNVPANAFSVRMRIIPQWSGNPSASQALCCAASKVGNLSSGFAWQINTSGNFVLYIFDRYGNFAANIQTTYVFNPTSGTAVEVMMQYDGTGNSNSIKFFVNGVQVEQQSPTGAFTRLQENIGGIGVGYYNNLGANYWLNEFLIFDTAIGAYTPGADFYSVTALDGDSNIGAGAANIRAGVTETIAGVVATGTAAIPTAANVRHGVAVDATTGTCYVPGTHDVRLGVNVDASVGLCSVPTPSETLEGVAVDWNGTGLYTEPLAADVRFGSTFGLNYSGLCHVPTAAQTQHGVAVDVAGTGTYRGADLWTSLAANKIKLGETQTQDGVTVTGTLRYIPINTDSVAACMVTANLSDLQGNIVTANATLTATLKKAFESSGHVVSAGTKTANFDNTGLATLVLAASDAANKTYDFSISYTDPSGNLKTVKFVPAEVPALSAIDITDLTDPV